VILASNKYHESYGRQGRSEGKGTFNSRREELDPTPHRGKKERYLNAQLLETKVKLFKNRDTVSCYQKQHLTGKEIKDQKLRIQVKVLAPETMERSKERAEGHRENARASGKNQGSHRPARWRLVQGKEKKTSNRRTASRKERATRIMTQKGGTDHGSGRRVASKLILENWGGKSVSGVGKFLRTSELMNRDDSEEWSPKRGHSKRRPCHSSLGLVLENLNEVNPNKREGKVCVLYRRALPLKHSRKRPDTRRN